MCTNAPTGHANPTQVTVLVTDKAAIIHMVMIRVLHIVDFLNAQMTTTVERTVRHLPWIKSLKLLAQQWHQTGAPARHGSTPIPKMGQAIVPENGENKTELFFASKQLVKTNMGGNHSRPAVTLVRHLTCMHCRQWHRYSYCSCHCFPWTPWTVHPSFMT
jgi:hypothetical protein